MEIEGDAMDGAAAGADMQPEPFESLAEEPMDAVEEGGAHVDVGMSEASGEGLDRRGAEQESSLPSNGERMPHCHLFLCRMLPVTTP